jgi:hypothetical protein
MMGLDSEKFSEFRDFLKTKLHLNLAIVTTIPWSQPVHRHSTRRRRRFQNKVSLSMVTTDPWSHSSTITILFRTNFLYPWSLFSVILNKMPRGARTKGSQFVINRHLMKTSLIYSIEMSERLEKLAEL